MENLIFTINGNKPGELVHFEVEFEKGKFKNVCSNVASFKTIDDVINAEKKGIFKII